MIAACAKSFEAPPIAQVEPWYQERWAADTSILEAYSVTIVPACSEAAYLRFERRATGYTAFIDSDKPPGTRHRQQWVQPRHAVEPLTAEKTKWLVADLEVGHFWELPIKGGDGIGLDGEEVYLEGYQVGSRHLFSHLTNPDHDQIWLIDALLQLAPATIHGTAC